MPRPKNKQILIPKNSYGTYFLPFFAVTTCEVIRYEKLYRIIIFNGRKSYSNLFLSVFVSSVS